MIPDTKLDRYIFTNHPNTYANTPENASLVNAYCLPIQNMDGVKVCNQALQSVANGQ